MSVKDSLVHAAVPVFKVKRHSVAPDLAGGEIDLPIVGVSVGVGISLNVRKPDPVVVQRLARLAVLRAGKLADDVFDVGFPDGGDAGIKLHSRHTHKFIVPGLPVDRAVEAVVENLGPVDVVGIRVGA